MKTNNKIAKMISINKDVVDDIQRKSKEEDFNFSAWVEETYYKTQMTEKGLSAAHKKYSLLCKDVEKRLNSIKTDKKKLIGSLTPEMKAEIKSAKEIIKKYPDKLKYRLKLWNNLFNKNQLTMSEYMDMLGILEEEK